MPEIIAGAGSVEVALTTFVINIRYILMSLSLSQKVDKGVSLLERMIWSFGITDETFVVASMREEKLSSAYMFGLITLPILGWNLGTLLGGGLSMLLPMTMQNAMGIGLYAMFIALILPASRDSLKVCIIVLIAVAVVCLLKYVPVFGVISAGFRIIIATVVAAGCGAYFFPRYDENGEELV